MKKNNMMVAFILNFLFTIIELIGGIFTNSISIMSDAIHDLGDTFSIGISLILEKISKKKPDKKYTYGYARYSIIGALINLCVLLIGSTIVLYNAIPRLFSVQEVNYNGMLLLAVLGVIINGIGVLKTLKSEKISEKIISLHLLEDVLGWIAVLVTSIVMKIFNIPILDPILSIVISLFMLYNVFKNMKQILNILLEKTPNNINIEEIKEKVLTIKNVSNIHHIHVWTLDNQSNYLTAHIVATSNVNINDIKHMLEHLNIQHSTLEIEKYNNDCNELECKNDIKIKHHIH